MYGKQIAIFFFPISGKEKKRVGYPMWDTKPSGFAYWSMGSTNLKEKKVKKLNKNRHHIGPT
jgi:hypothetical protein